MSYLFVPLTTARRAGADVALQTRAVLADVDTRLRAAGSSLNDAVAMTVYLRDGSDFGRMNEAYRGAWTAALPTRTTVVASLPDGDAVVGIAAVAVRSGAAREPLHPRGWLPSANPYSYIVRSDDTVFLSGLLARSGRDQSVLGTTVKEQTRAIFANARELLDAAGFRLEDVVFARVFLPDLADAAAMTEAYDEYFPGQPPVRAVFGAGLTAPPYKVEITFIARKGAKGKADDLIVPIRSADALSCRPFSA